MNEDRAARAARFWKTRTRSQALTQFEIDNIEKPRLAAEFAEAEREAAERIKAMCCDACKKKLDAQNLIPTTVARKWDYHCLWCGEVVDDPGAPCRKTFDKIKGEWGGEGAGT